MSATFVALAKGQGKASDEVAAVARTADLHFNGDFVFACVSVPMDHLAA